MKYLFILTFLIVLTSTTYALDREVTKNDKNIELLHENSLRLEEQNKILKSALTDVRNSYYWALGFAATVLILFLGSNVYFLRNRYDADKAALKSHVDQELKVFRSENDEMYLSMFQERDKKISEDIPKKISAATNSLDSKIAGLKRSIIELQISVLEVELDKTKNSGVKGNVLRQSFHLARKCKELGTGSYLDWDISNYLSDVCDLLDEGIKFDGDDIPEVTKFLAELPNQFEDIVKKVKSRLSA